MIGMILLTAAVIVLGISTAVSYKAYADTLVKYEKTAEELEIERIKNDALQKENASLHDHVWNMSQNLMHREESSNAAKQGND